MDCASSGGKEARGGGGGGTEVPNGYPLPNGCAERKL